MSTAEGGSKPPGESSEYTESESPDHHTAPDAEPIATNDGSITIHENADYHKQTVDPIGGEKSNDANGLDNDAASHNNKESPPDTLAHSNAPDDNVEHTPRVAAGSELLEPRANSPSGTQHLSDHEHPETFWGGNREISRINTNASVRSDADIASAIDDEIMRALTGSSRRTYTTPLPAMGGGLDYPPPVPDREVYQVDYDGPEDPFSPLNWSTKKKYIQGLCLSCGTLSVAFGSSVYGPSSDEVMEHFHVGLVVALLGVSLYVAGFAAGPIVWGPLSETFGRRPPLLIGLFGFVCFSFAAATAKDFQTLMLSRFFMGALGAASVSIVPACFADMFTTKTRGYAMLVYSLMVFGGPMIGPIVGGFIANSYLHWRWTQYITGIFGSLALTLIAFITEESYRPKLLVNKAKELRQRTGNWGIYAPFETAELDLIHIARTSLLRPIKMLMREPVLLVLSIYSGFIYGILYLCLEAVPYVYGNNYGFKKGLMDVPYVALFTGIQIACASSALYFEPRFHRALEQSGRYVYPEARLPPMFVGSIAFPIGIFWFSWTGAYAKYVHWIVPAIGSSFIGIGLLLIFLPCQNFIVDTYLPFAASATAANAFMRAAMAAAFPLFATAMFKNLGAQWAGTILGCIACLLAPLPYIFAAAGPWLRGKSKFAYKDDLK